MSNPSEQPGSTSGSKLSLPPKSGKQFTEMGSTSDEIDDRVENDPIVHEEESLSTVSSETIDSLPSDLKRCLLYTSVFPRNYVFEKDALIHLWIDAGFISDEKGLVEMIGGDYFDELLSLKIFHETSVDCSNVQPRLYKIEDNVFDLLKNHVVAEDTASQDDDVSKHQISASDLETSTLAVERVLETANQGPPSNQDVMVSSFDNLPKHLRRCLRYTSLFRKHCEFEKDKLVHLWIAAGLIFDEQGKLMEDTGGEYFDQLVTMNLFCESSAESSLFSVEDNVYDQLQECPDGDYARLEGDEGGKVSVQARHLSVIDDRVDKLDLEAFKKLSELQSLLLLQEKKRCITRIPYDLFLNLKCLRILDLSSTGLEELPSSVGSLEELRYLDLSDTCIRWLPETLTSLFNLQTLKLGNCCAFVQLPKDITKMTGLRHLDLDIIQQLTFMPAGMGKLTNLQTLRAFVVGKKNGSKIAELKKMENLRGSLSIIKLEHVLTAEEAKEAMLHSKRLHRLVLQWSRPCLAEEVLEALEPNKHLEELEIVCYGGRVLSSWLGDSSFFRLSSIYLYNCKNCTLLPPLGRLPCLQLLRIGQMDAVKEVNNHFSNAGHPGMGFPRLEILQFEGMPGLEKWIGITEDEMPCLRELTVIDCPKLIQFPKLSFLKFLQHLEIGLCFQLPLLIEEGVSLPTSLERLVINDCPKLEEWCYTVEWKQIAGRASIWINGKYVDAPAAVVEEISVPDIKGGETAVERTVNRIMQSDEEIKVECLSEEEAWDSPSIEPIAKDVAKECAGLPLAVVVTGKSLQKEEDVHVCQDALNQLKSATFQFGDTEVGLFERLKLSYDRLKEVEQSCFLYCALYPEEHEIRVVALVERWRLEGFTSRSGMDSLDDANDRGHTIVKNLVDASLVERGTIKDYGGERHNTVKMHDVLRDLALQIASSKFLVRAGLGIEECPYDEKEWEEARRISLMDNKLSGGLPTNPRCNELSTLLLNGNKNLEYIPDMFFQHMPSLRVLDLNGTGIKVVPASVSNLVNLRGLYASSWVPVDLPREIGALKKLEVLRVNVGSLPIEVRQLTSLRRLRVKFYKDTEEGMKTICSNGVISSLFQLEDLRIDVGYQLRKKWCKVVDESRVVEEVGRLKRLTRLEFDFSRIECLEHFLAQRNTNSCPELKIFHLSMSSERESSSEVKMSQIISQTLEECRVWHCPAMETIVESNGPSTSTTNVTTTVLLNLKELELYDLPNLRSICEDPRHRFTKLTKLLINKCPKLSSCVFTQGMIQHMPNLEVLDVWECEGIKEIVMREDVEVANCEGIEEIVMREDVEETNHHFFPKLRSLNLQSCQNLVRIWKGVSQPWPSIQEIVVRNCPNLENLNLNAVDFQNPLAALRKIEGKREWWQALKWEDKKSKHRLQAFFHWNFQDRYIQRALSQ